MLKSRLLFNDMPVFHENPLRIRCGRVISGTNVKMFFAFFVLSASVLSGSGTSVRSF